MTIDMKIHFLITVFASAMACSAVHTAEVHKDIFRPGEFFIGCNYWGSKNGVHMWNAGRWDPAEIEKDIAALAESGVEVLRIFPTWPDFQPIVRNFKFQRHGAEYLNELTDTPVHDPLWLEPGAVERLKFFCDTAQKHGVKLMVSLVTGWMSGRLFTPRVVENCNLLTDPEAIMWEGRLARALVRTMKYHPAIVAWDLGNECNCMEKVQTTAQAWNWLNAISSAIRMEDSTRPVVSGMHCLTSNADGSGGDSLNWNLQMQGELLDVLTPHPYPAPWRVDANRGPFNGFRNALHQVSQCLFYESVAGKIAFPQEVGSFGPTITPGRIAALGFRQEMFACWQHGMNGFLWWCAFDQTHLRYPPFSNNAMERELGMMQADSGRKPGEVARAMKEFKAFKDSLPFKALPPRKVDAVCLVSEREHFYHQCFGALMLSAQAGFDVKFVGAESRQIPDSDFYIVPSGTGWETYSQFAWEGMLDRVKSGATLLVTRGGSAGYSRWLEATGLEQQMYREARNISFEMDGVKLSADDSFTALQTPVSCNVVSRDATGNPVVTVNRYGNGKVIVVNFDLEKAAVARLANVFEGDFSNELWRIYAYAAKEAGVKRILSRDDSRIVVTEHPKSGGTTIICALNTREENVNVHVAIKGEVVNVWNGSCSDGTLSIRGNDGCILEVR